MKSYKIALTLLIAAFCAASNLFAQSCPTEVGYKQLCPAAGSGFFMSGGFLNNVPSPATLNFEGSCSGSLDYAYYGCNSGHYYGDNMAPYCEDQSPTGSITFSNGMVCNYIDGDLVPCNDLITTCKQPIIEFAQDFIKTDPNCKLWEGPCATESDIWRNGNVYIGTLNIPQGGQKLVVKGGITTEMLQLCKAEWCDYVFEDTFSLMPLKDVARYIDEKGHLPGCTPQETISREGGFMLEQEAVNQQAKIEEIFLHLIASQQRLDKLEKKMSAAALSVQADAATKRLQEEYPERSTTFNQLQISCFVVKSAPNGTMGIIPSPDSGPYNISWTGPTSGNMPGVNCNGTLKIYNLPTGTYSVTVTNASGMSAVCTRYIPNNAPGTDCAVLSDPLCKQGLIHMLEEEAFGTVPNCVQWEGDPCSDEDPIYRLGTVEIGTSVGRTGYSLAVKGGILTDKFRVELCESGSWCDYVFDEGYPLPSLYDVDAFIQVNNHLPGSITQAEVSDQGGFEMRSVKLDHQKKIEEAYLYLIDLNQKKNNLQQRLNSLYEQN